MKHKKTISFTKLGITLLSISTIATLTACSNDKASNEVQTSTPVTSEVVKDSSTQTSETTQAPVQSTSEQTVEQPISEQAPQPTPESVQPVETSDTYNPEAVQPNVPEEEEGAPTAEVQEQLEQQDVNTGEMLQGEQFELVVNGNTYHFTHDSDTGLNEKDTATNYYFFGTRTESDGSVTLQYHSKDDKAVMMIHLANDGEYQAQIGAVNNTTHTTSGARAYGTYTID